MPNPTVSRRTWIGHNDDGSVVEVKESLRANGDRSQMVFYRELSGRSLGVWHVVYDADGGIVHGPEAKLSENEPWPPPGYEGLTHE